MILRFCFGVGHAVQRGEKFFGGIHGHQAHAHRPLKGLHHLLRLALAQHAGIHEDAGSWSPTARCTNAAATDESTPPLRPPPPDAPDCARGCAIASTIEPGVQSAYTARYVQETANELRAVRRVVHFRVKLNGKQLARGSAMAATGQLSDSGDDVKAGGGSCRLLSPWVIQALDADCGF